MTGKAGRSKNLTEKLAKNAEIVGKEIAKSNCILVTGACMGVPDVAARSASKEGGLVLSYSPAKNLKEHIEPPISYPWPAQNEELIFTGYGKIGRNVLSIFECDGVICIGGGIGTLNEFSIAYHEGKVIGILEGMEGVVEKIFQMEEDFRETGAVIIRDKDPSRLVRKVIQAIEKKQENPRREIPITFKNERGKELVGILHLPDLEKPPLVLISHGFQGSKTDRKYIRLARALAREGIAVYRFDFEGCGDSEGDPKEITVKREVRDLYSALNTILKQSDIDSDRISLIGGSLGSVVSALFAKDFEKPIKTLVFLTQAFNQKQLFKIWYTEEDRKKMVEQRFLIKDEKEIGQDYYLENKNKDYSSALSELNLPILLIQGGEDKDVPLKFSEKLAKDYKNITLKVLPQATHKFDDFEIQKSLIKIIVNWLKEKL